VERRHDGARFQIGGAAPWWRGRVRQQILSSPPQPRQLRRQRQAAVRDLQGLRDASKVSPDWHGWLHHTFDEPPTTAPLKRRPWEKDYQQPHRHRLAWRPKGSIARGGERQKASGDYQPWTPE